MAYSIVINQQAPLSISDKVALEAKMKIQLGNVTKLKENSYYGKMIEDLVHYKRAWKN